MSWTAFTFFGIVATEFVRSNPLKPETVFEIVFKVSFVNHTLIIAKQYLYSCRRNKSLPSIKILLKFQN